MLARVRFALGLVFLGLLVSVAEGGWRLSGHKLGVIYPATIYRFEEKKTGGADPKQDKKADDKVQKSELAPDPQGIQKEIDFWKNYQKSGATGGSLVNDPGLEFLLLYRSGDRRVVVEVRKNVVVSPPTGTPGVPGELAKGLQGVVATDTIKDPDTKTAKLKSLANAYRNAAKDIRAGSQVTGSKTQKLTTGPHVTGAIRYYELNSFGGTTDLENTRAFVLDYLSVPKNAKTSLTPQTLTGYADRLDEAAAALEQLAGK